MRSQSQSEHTEIEIEAIDVLLYNILYIEVNKMSEEHQTSILSEEEIYEFFHQNYQTLPPYKPYGQESEMRLLDLSEEIYFQKEQNEQLVDHSTGEQQDTPPTQQAEAAPKKKAKARKDNRAKNLPQNISSTIQTCLPKILCSGQKVKKSDLKEVKKRLKQFLDEHKANNNVLVVLFVYFFMMEEGAAPEQFCRLANVLTDYLAKRIQESAYFEKEEREIYLERVDVNKKLVEKYFDGTCQELDFDWLRQLCSGLLSGRQRNTIDKPLKALAVIQTKLLTLNTELPSLELYLIQASSDLYSEDI